MVWNKKVFCGSALKIAVGITVLVLLLAGGVSYAYPQVDNIALGKPVSATTNGVDVNTDICGGQWPSDITDGSLDYQPVSSCVEDGVIGYNSPNYNQLLLVNVSIDLQGTYRITKIRYNMGNVQRAETWNADVMESPFGRIATVPGSPYTGAWTEQTGDLILSKINIKFEKTRTTSTNNWLFIGEIEVYGIPVPNTGPVHNINKGTNYTTIQAAIDDANPGDEIHVDSGTYYENVNVGKRLILRGVDTGGGKPVVDAGRSGSVITLSAGWSTFEGFTAINGYNFGIGLESNNNNRECV